MPTTEERLTALEEGLAEVNLNFRLPAAHAPVETVINGFRYIDGVNTNQWVGESGDGTNPGATGGTVTPPTRVPDHWTEGQLVRRKGTPRNGQQITGMNREEGQIETLSWDDSEGWKPGSWHWELFDRVDGSGNVIPEPNA